MPSLTELVTASQVDSLALTRIVSGATSVADAVKVKVVGQSTICPLAQFGKSIVEVVSDPDVTAVEPAESKILNDTAHACDPS